MASAKSSAVGKSIHQITEEILDSYQRIGGINNIDGSNLPSKRAIATFCEDLLQVLFPGFHDQEPIHSHDLRRVTLHRIASMADRLKPEVCKSLRIREPDCPELRADELLAEFLQALPGVRELLRTDVEAAYEGDPSTYSYEEIILAFPFLEAVAIQRAAHVMFASCVPLIPRIMTEWAHSRTGIDIHPGARIGSHFFIDHGTGVVIGETCNIGNHVKLYQGVSLGARSFHKDREGKILKGGKRHPDVQDGVTIYANSNILGGDTVIGEGTTIGGNVFLTHSVPAQSLVYYEETQLKIVPKKSREDVASFPKPE
jgi:serine O-acetyltransferase